MKTYEEEIEDLVYDALLEQGIEPEDVTNEQFDTEWLNAIERWCPDYDPDEDAWIGHAMMKYPRLDDPPW